MINDKTRVWSSLFGEESIIIQDFPDIYDLLLTNSSMEKVKNFE